jgi:hypothetical protein
VRGARDFSLFQFMPMGSGAHPVSYSLSTIDFPRDQVAGNDIDHSLHIVASLRMNGAILPLPHMPS